MKNIRVRHIKSALTGELCKRVRRHWVHVLRVRKSKLTKRGLTLRTKRGLRVHRPYGVYCMTFPCCRKVRGPLARYLPDCDAIFCTRFFFSHLTDPLPVTLLLVMRISEQWQKQNTYKSSEKIVCVYEKKKWNLLLRAQNRILWMVNEYVCICEIDGNVH